jgi:hypothetical protein
MSEAKRLFCIIEEDMVRMFFETVLGDAGWEVYALGNIEDASFRIPEFAPDVIIFDTCVVAPQRDEIAGWDTGKAKKVGLGFIGEKELWGSEIDAFLEKPLEPLTLSDRILSLL